MSKDNFIKKSIDNIEPREGAEERMYKNIMCKAEAESSVRKNNISIYRTASVMAACLVIAVAAGIFIINRNDDITSDLPKDSITAISSEPVTTETVASETEGVDIGNPFAQAFTLEDVQEWGLDFTIPEGAEDINYHIWDNSMADIRFVLNGSTYYYTVSTESGDNSGIYDDTAEIRNITENDGTLEITKSGYYRAFWNGEKYYYCLSNTDGADVEAVIQTAEMLMEQAQ